LLQAPLQLFGQDADTWFEHQVVMAAGDLVDHHAACGERPPTEVTLDVIVDQSRLTRPKHGERPRIALGPVLTLGLEEDVRQLELPQVIRHRLTSAGVPAETEPAPSTHQLREDVIERVDDGLEAKLAQFSNSLSQASIPRRENRTISVEQGEKRR